MSKCWIFGDSFQDSNFPRGQKESWCDILFSKKGYEVKNFSKAGLSTESIILSCIDMIPKFKSNDLVLVFLSAEKRFMRVEGSGDIHCESGFKKYIDTPRRHTDIWELYAKNNRDQTIIDYADKLSSPLTDKLKHSVWNNYIGILLRNKKNVNFKIIHGHYEPVEVKSNYVKEYMHYWELRTFLPNVTAYFDMRSALKLKAGYCLINDFFHCQIEHLSKTVGEDFFIELEKICNHCSEARNSKSKRLKSSYADIMQSEFLKPLRKLYGKENVIFYDTWHLNKHGQVIYADYAKDYEWIK
tara:strand:- start:3089 stop:3985 length:897 start_codon:yes stop_codon:yes gene_type:complete